MLQVWLTTALIEMFARPCLILARETAWVAMLRDHASNLSWWLYDHCCCVSTTAVTHDRNEEIRNYVEEIQLDHATFQTEIVLQGLAFGPFAPLLLLLMPLICFFQTRAHAWACRFLVEENDAKSGRRVAQTLMVQVPVAFKTLLAFSSFLVLNPLAMYDLQFSTAAIAVYLSFVIILAAYVTISFIRISQGFNPPFLDLLTEGGTLADKHLPNNAVITNNQEQGQNMYVDQLHLILGACAAVIELCDELSRAFDTKVDEAVESDVARFDDQVILDEAASLEVEKGVALFEFDQMILDEAQMLCAANDVALFQYEPVILGSDAPTKGPTQPSTAQQLPSSTTGTGTGSNDERLAVVEQAFVNLEERQQQEFNAEQQQVRKDQRCDTQL